MKKFFQFVNLEEVANVVESNDSKGVSAEVYNTLVESLDLSSRTFNCLKRSGLNRVGDIIEFPIGPEMLKLKNFGQKSLDELEEKLQAYAGYTAAPGLSSVKVQQLANSTLTTVQNARQAFDVVNNSTQVKQQLETIREQYTTLETKAIDAGLIQGKRFSAGIQTELEANVSLDLRYLYYIKQHGPPPNGVFDPVKLAEFKWVDSSGNPLTDQNFVQYTGLGLSVPITDTDEAARQYEEFWSV